MRILKQYQQIFFFLLAMGSMFFQQIFPQGKAVQQSAKQEIWSIEANKAKRTPAEEKISSDVLDILNKVDSEKQRGKTTKESLYSFRSLFGISMDQSDRLHVTVRLKKGFGNEVEKLKSKIQEANGIIQTATEEGKTYPAELYCWISSEALRNIAAFPSVGFVGLLYPAFTNTDTVTAGDKQLLTNTARDRFTLNGNGVNVGVISDGVQARDTVRWAGELPYITVVNAGRPDGDEG
ncbi:MAG: hypothetical protein HYV29_08945, partial [Ignavibacteriales bacterium]|nr:hypothetical protein [Ignavibacteriales bacterium]